MLHQYNSCTLFTVVQLLLWWSIPGLFDTHCLLLNFRMLTFMKIWFVTVAVSVKVIFLFWWHDGPPPEKPPYVPKKLHKWKKLPQQFCQLLKSWTHQAYALLKRTKIFASEQLIQLHIKLQGAILAHRNRRRLHIRKMLAFKHNHHSFARPRVKFRKHLYVFPS